MLRLKMTAVMEQVEITRCNCFILIIQWPRVLISTRNGLTMGFNNDFRIAFRDFFLRVVIVKTVRRTNGCNTVE